MNTFLFLLPFGKRHINKITRWREFGTEKITNYELRTKTILLPLLLLFAVWQAQAQTDDGQLEYFMAQIDSAQQERNALKIASIYGEIVALCRTQPFEDKLPKNLYNYGMWSTYAGNHQTAIGVLIELLDMPDNPDDDKSLFTLKARANNLLGITYFFFGTLG